MAKKKSHCQKLLAGLLACRPFATADELAENVSFSQKKKYSTSFDRIIVVLLVFFSINAPSHFTVANILWVLYFGKEYQKSFAQQKI